MNSDGINHHVTPSMGNVHGEILTFCTPGTMLHCKHIPVSSYSVWRFLSMFREFSDLVRCLQCLNMKDIFFTAGRIWTAVVVIQRQVRLNLTISRSLISLLEYRASPSRAEKRHSYPNLGNKLLCNTISSNVYAHLKFTTVSQGERWRHISGHMTIQHLA